MFIHSDSRRSVSFESFMKVVFLARCMTYHALCTLNGPFASWPQGNGNRRNSIATVRVVGDITENEQLTNIEAHNQTIERNITIEIEGIRRASADYKLLSARNRAFERDAVLGIPSVERRIAKRHSSC